MKKDKDLQRIIEAELKLYRTLKVAVENHKELTAAGLDKVFPSLIDNISIKELKYKQIHRALHEALSNEERTILEKKYLGKYSETDLTIYLELCMTKTQYYRIKKEAIQQLALALGII